MNNLDIKKDIAFDVADSFVSYSDEITVAKFVMNLQSEEVYKSTGFKNAGDLAVSLTYNDDEPQNIKSVEENTSFIISLISDELILFSDDAFTAFAINEYDEDFSFEGYRND